MAAGGAHRRHPTGLGTGDAGAARVLSFGLLPLRHFTMLPFAGFVDVLRLSADEGDRSRPRACRWTVVAPGARSVRASCGIEVAAWEDLGDPARFDWIVVVGGLLYPGQPQLDPGVGPWLRRAQAARVGLVGICTGSLALVEAGAIRAGRPVCVSWYHHRDLAERHPAVRPVSDRLWLRAGRLVTCAGGTAAIDLAASLVRERLGDAAVRKGLDIMVTDGTRAASAAQPLPPGLLRIRNPRVRRAVLLMEQSLAAPLPAAALAEGVAISRRQLERLFRAELGTSVQEFARQLRLSRAVWRMARGRDRLTDIAQQSGFADQAHFSRQFRAAFGKAPSAARRAGPEALLGMHDQWWPHGGAPGDAPLRRGMRPRVAPPAPAKPTGEERRPYR